ncbi:MAG: HEAT repeat domain-containing protein [Elusimicrobia bacterium]|nr:HEAT repeat domain-containing protein [Elusimicrobiota bacterium]
MILPLLLAAAATAAASGPEDLGRALAEAARRGGAATVAVAAFESPRAAPAGMSETAGDAVLRGIVASRRVRAVERERLGAVLSERGLAAAGAVAGAESPALRSGDAVVVGRLERAAGGWALTARVVASATGEVLGAGRADLPAAAAEAAPAESDELPPLGRLVDAAHALATVSAPSDLAALVRDASAPAPRRAAAVMALAEEGGADDLVLADALRSDEALVRYAAALALSRAEAPWAAGPLRRVLRDDPSWLARLGAAQALARGGDRAAETELAAARASDPSWRVRRQAAVALIARAEARP